MFTAPCPSWTHTISCTGGLESHTTLKNYTYYYDTTVCTCTKRPPKPAKQGQ